MRSPKGLTLRPQTPVSHVAGPHPGWPGCSHSAAVVHSPPDAPQPTEIPPTGWKDVLARVRAEAKDDGVTLMSAGVAFYALLALVPGLVAARVPLTEARLLDRMLSSAERRAQVVALFVFFLLRFAPGVAARRCVSSVTRS